MNRDMDANRSRKPNDDRIYGPEWQDVRRNKRLRNCTGENVSSNTTYEAAYKDSKDVL